MTLLADPYVKAHSSSSSLEMEIHQKKRKGESPLSIAPMMGYTNRHFRYFMRGITKETLLYTEMIPSQAILHGKCKDLLSFSPIEKPLVLQLAGSDPKSLALCTSIAEDFGYDEVNLNIGCPSARAEAGTFGLCLMQEPQRVAECISAMQVASNLPVSIKHRIGLGTEANFEKLCHFVSQTSQAGCRKYIVHARTGILSKLSPKKNRTIPPLRYDLVYALARAFQQLHIELNGGIHSLERGLSLLKDKRETGAQLSGIMIGRAAYERPYLFAEADQMFYKSTQKIPSRQKLLKHLEAYLGMKKYSSEKEMARVLKHALHLFQGLPGARFWRSYLSKPIHFQQRPTELLKKASSQIPRELLNTMGNRQYDKDTESHHCS